VDAIKPVHASGFIFPNTIGRALDLDNLADQVIRPTLKLHNSARKGLGRHIVAVSPPTSKGLECQT
jgi:hypothetical protein